MTREIDKIAFFNAIGYEPHPKQWLYHNSKQRFRIPTCGRRFGKSTMAGRDLEPELFIPKKRFWIVGPTYDLGEKEFRVIWDDLIIGRGLGKDKRVKKGYSLRSGEMFIEFPWQTRVEVRSAQYPERLVGDSLDGVIMSEAAKHHLETWERFIRASLADRRGWATFPTTPEGHNWLYTLWQLGMNPEYPDFESWRFPSWDNPFVYPGGRNDPEVKLIEATTAPEWFMQEIGADFASFVGKIYGEFDELTHVKHHTYNPMWKNYIAFDWGYVNPMAAIEFQVDPQDNVYVWREWYHSYKRVEEMVNELKARPQPEGYKIDLTFGDAADPEAVANINYQYTGCIALPEAKKNWRAGIDCMKRFLRLHEVGEMDEYGTPKLVPKLFVDHSCVHTIREFQTYRAQETRAGVPATREAAARQDDHALDALRYGLMHIFELGVNRHLDEVYSISSFEELPASGYFTTGARF